jgi:hypothetical protein
MIKPMKTKFKMKSKTSTIIRTMLLLLMRTTIGTPNVISKIMGMLWRSV